MGILDAPPPNVGELMHVEYRQDWFTAVAGSYVDVLSGRFATTDRPARIRVVGADWKDDVAQTIYFVIAVRRSGFDDYFRVCRVDVVNVNKYMALPLIEARIPAGTPDAQYIFQVQQTNGAGTLQLSANGLTPLQMIAEVV